MDNAEQRKQAAGGEMPGVPESSKTTSKPQDSILLALPVIVSIDVYLRRVILLLDLILMLSVTFE
jgi:hypothetical protein